MIREEELLYLAALSHEIEESEKDCKEHAFSGKFEQRQQKLLAQVSGQNQTERKKVGKKISKKKVIALLAVAVLTVGTVTVAMGNNYMNLWNLLVEDEINEPSTKLVTDEDAYGNLQTYEEDDYINNICFGEPDSPEAEGSREWQQFQDEYMQTDEYWDAIGQNAEEYLSDYNETYGVVSKAMEDKLYEIAETYGLKLESKIKTIQAYDYEAMEYKDCYDILLNEQGLESFVADRSAFQLDYCLATPEGNFHGDFTWRVNDSKEMLQFSVSCKGVLESMSLNMGDLTDYEEWNYTNISGNDVMLMLNHANGKVYVFYSGAKAFVTVNGDSISYDGAGSTYWDQEKLEALADLFDFSQF